MTATLLLTNDDGILASGIQALRQAFAERWDILAVAPDRERSAASHALTLNHPLRANRLSDDQIAVDGTPTDCVMLALKGLLDEYPSFVVSGINTGANLGDDVLYSGTVAAAAEATVLGVPALAVSMVDPENTDLDWAAGITTTIVSRVMEHHPLPDGVFLNVNLPPVWSGGKIEVTALGTRTYRDVITEKTDPRGIPYYWIAGQVEKWSGSENCDFAAIDRGNISITPLHLDMTAHHALGDIAGWSFL